MICRDGKLETHPVKNKVPTKIDYLKYDTQPVKGVPKIHED